MTKGKRKTMASSSSNSRFADITSVEEFIEGQENENTRKKTEQNVALLKEYCDFHCRYS